MAKLICLIACLVAVAAAWPKGGWENSDDQMGGGEEMEGTKEGMEKLGMLIHLEQAIREKTEKQITPEHLKDVHKDFVKYAFARHHMEMAKKMKDAMEGKEDFMKMAFKHFMDKMAEKKDQMGGASTEMGGDNSMGGAMGMGGGKMGGEMGGEMGGAKMDPAQAMHLMTMWKLFVEFETAFLEQGNIMAMGLDEKTKRALFFETFGRFVKNSMAIKKHSAMAAKVHGLVEQSKQKAMMEREGKGDQDMKAKFMEFVKYMMSEKEGDM